MKKMGQFGGKLTIAFKKTGDFKSMKEIQQKALQCFDGKKATLTVIKTARNQIFGGFSEWTQHDSNQDKFPNKE